MRLLDPPLHEFLPDLTELSVRVALAEERGEPDEGSLRLLAAVRGMHESEPDARAARRPARARRPRAVRHAGAGDRRGGRASGKKAGGDPRPEIMIPLVGAVQELEAIREESERVLAEVCEREGVDVTAADRHDDRGAPRGADRGRDRRVRRVLLLRHQRPHPDDLGLLPGRRRGRVLPPVPRQGHLRRSRRSSRSTARASAGSCRSRAEAGRAARPDLKLGVCGEHGGDPDSVHFFHDVGLDYVSCSPFRVPVARLEAGRAALGGERAGS